MEPSLLLLVFFISAYCVAYINIDIQVTMIQNIVKELIIEVILLQEI